MAELILIGILPTRIMCEAGEMIIVYSSVLITIIMTRHRQHLTYFFIYTVNFQCCQPFHIFVQWNLCVQLFWKWCWKQVVCAIQDAGYRKNCSSYFSIPDGFFMTFQNTECRSIWKGWRIRVKSLSCCLSVICFVQIHRCCLLIVSCRNQRQMPITLTKISHLKNLS